MSMGRTNTYAKAASEHQCLGFTGKGNLKKSNTELELIKSGKFTTSVVNYHILRGSFLYMNMYNLTGRGIL